MAWTTTTDRLGTGVPSVIYDVQLNDIGALMQFRDPLYGEGLFIFLPGVAATVAGDMVEYTTTAGVASPTGSTTRWAGVANSGKLLAVAVAANVLTTNWAWYQVLGAAIVNISGTVAAGDRAFYNALGSVATALVAGKQINGMVAVSANGVPAAGKATYQIAFPVAQGNIT